MSDQFTHDLNEIAKTANTAIKDVKDLQEFLRIVLGKTAHAGLLPEVGNVLEELQGMLKVGAIAGLAANPAALVVAVIIGGTIFALKHAKPLVPGSIDEKRWMDRASGGPQGGLR